MAISASKIYLGENEIQKAYLGSDLVYGWTPSEMTTSLWLDASDASTIIQSGGFVSQWNDKSGNNRNATQAGVSSRPAYTNGGMNGKNVLTFDGLDDSLITADLSYVFPNQAVLFIVATINNDSAYTIYNTGGLQEWWRFFGDGRGYPQTFRLFRAESYTPMPDSGSHIYSIVSQSSVWEMWGDGTSLGGPIPGSYSSGTSHTIGNGGSGGPLNGSISEVILLNTTSSIVERQKIEGYLAWKWGLVANLPVNHPYKIFSP